MVNYNNKITNKSNYNNKNYNDMLLLLLLLVQQCVIMSSSAGQTFSNSSYSTSPSPFRSNILNAISNIRGGADTQTTQSSVCSQRLASLKWWQHDQSFSSWPWHYYKLFTLLCTMPPKLWQDGASEAMARRCLRSYGKTVPPKLIWQDGASETNMARRCLRS